MLNHHIHKLIDIIERKNMANTLVGAAGSQLPHGVAQGLAGHVVQSCLTGIGGTGGGGIAKYATQNIPINPAPFWCTGEPDLLAMLCMRMRWGIYSPERRQAGTEKAKFTRLMVYQVEDDAVVVAYNAGQRPVIIIDPMKLFPSDPLITQLRLLES